MSSTAPPPPPPPPHARSYSVAVPREPTSKHQAFSRSLSVPEVHAAPPTPQQPAASDVSVVGADPLSDDPQQSQQSQSQQQQQQQQSDQPFDVYKFLNENGNRVLRDPILQQMTVVRYEGEVDNATGFFHGHGKLVSTLGYTYTGQFDGGLMSGRGRIEWTDGTVYEGTMKDNVISGEGKYTWPNGDWYDGSVDQCVRHGKGTFYYKSLNETYEGTWHKGMRHGKGTLKYTPDGAISYRGGWVRDKRNGHGIMTYACGVYDGEWKNDIRHGKGRMTWKRDGVVVEEYRGEWVGGVPCGQGQSTYIRPVAETPGTPQMNTLTVTPQGPVAGTAESHLIKRDAAINTYTGEFLDGLRHGFGTFLYDDGSKYEGQWVANQKHGEGKFTSATGVIYFGSFKDGNPVTPVSDNKPETTVSSPLPLYIRDILGEAENNVLEAITAVQSVISRNSGLFKKLFAFYGACDTAIEVITTPSNWKANRTQGTVSLIQFFRMLNDAKLLNRHTTIAVVGRLLLAFRDRNVTTSVASYLLGEQNGSLPTTTATAGPPPPPEVVKSASPDRVEVASSIGVTPKEQGLLMTPKDSSASPAGSRSERNSVTSMRSSKTGRAASATRGDALYSAPWEKYQTELHLFVGELNYRDFVEAIVRVTDHHYETARVGTLAQKLTLVIEEHLTPFTCSKLSGDPLFPLSREHKAVVAPHLPLLEKYFLTFSKTTSFGLGGSTTSATLRAAGGVAGVTMTVRQFALMLRELGAVDGEKLSLTSIPQLCMYDKHPQLTTHVGKKLLQTTAPVHQQQLAGTITTNAASAAAAVSSGASASAAANNLDKTTSERGSTLSLETEPRFIEGGETIYRSRCALSKRSKGLGNSNLHSTLVMELELTFVEMVDLVLRAGVLRCTETTQAQRIATFLQTYFVANQSKKL